MLLGSESLLVQGQRVLLQGLLNVRVRKSNCDWPVTPQLCVLYAPPMQP